VPFGPTNIVRIAIAVSESPAKSRYRKILAKHLPRQDPHWREILADQNRQLAQLAQDSDTSLGPLSRERARP
jgi:hypothetical protein